MSAFFIKKPFKFGQTNLKGEKLFESKNEDISSEPFWESQRNEALEVIVDFFNHRKTNWENTIKSLGNLNLSESVLRRIIFYETEQQKSIIFLLAKILVSWEKSDNLMFQESVLALAREIRPSVSYVEYDPEEKLNLSESQLSALRFYLKTEASYLKESVAELQKLAENKLDFSGHTLEIPTAETLIREKIGLPFFDFAEPSEEPSFSNGYYPALLQESTDLGF